MKTEAHRSAKNLNGVYVLLAIVFIVLGLAIGFKKGDWSAALIELPIAATLCFGIVYLMQRAIVRDGPIVAWRILRFILPLLIFIWIVQAVIFFFRGTGR